ncbi:hypothetical protein AAIE21_10625 [Paenibacillus sp. 102]|uniref:hypothetical protein n=1 Tax=Paenibacillus sp. 102 TaxID=3120823 RepID=UPI0031BA8F02
MFINPLDKDSSVLYYKDIVFVKSLEQPNCDELKEVLTRRIKNSFDMMELSESTITFEEMVVRV